MKWQVVPALVLACASLAGAKESDSTKTKKHDKPANKTHDKERERAPGPVSLELESVDLVTARAWVRVGGVQKGPDGRLFVFHDDRERHFVALYSRCEPAPSRKVDDESEHPRTEASELRCELELPRPYLGANVRRVTVRLHNKDVYADDEEVRARFASAREKEGAPPLAVAPALGSAQASSRGGERMVDDPGFIPAEQIYPLPKAAPASETEDDGDDAPDEE